jgi:excinuclease ABC subunit C
MADLTKLVHDLPNKPGVYMWKDERGSILYIGKAAALRKRVGSYIKPRGHDFKTWALMDEAEDLEVIVTASDREAMLLEATMIKTHQPKYNIRLKDDKRRSWIRVDLNLEIPTFQITRDVERDGARYFGPYGGAKKLARLFDATRRILPVCTCTSPAKEKRECMDYHLGRCLGPCIGEADPKEYRALVDQMCLYLDGREAELLALLEGEMKAASDNLEFEKAGNIRDRLVELTHIMRSQRVVELNGKNRDVLGLARTELAALVEMLIIRGGRLIGHDHFMFEENLNTPDEEILSAFVQQYYVLVPQLPDEILLPTEISGMDELGVWLRESHDETIKIMTPVTENDSQLIDMAHENANRSLRKILILGEKAEPIITDAVKELKTALNLDKAPIHIEGFDIANIQGTDPTGSCVVFKNGKPDKSNYRMFRVRNKETPDDYAMMKEVIYRRYMGVLQRGDDLPNLILIDGGKGQLNVALEAVKELGLEYLTVASLAKKDEVLYTKELQDGVMLDYGSSGLSLVQNIRDEAHRFAQQYHHKLRERRFSGSILEEAPGIGQKRRKALLSAFGSYEKVRAATIAELADVEGMTLKNAQTLREWLDSEDPL